jgi:hypothetical protein
MLRLIDPERASLFLDALIIGFRTMVFNVSGFIVLRFCRILSLGFGLFLRVHGLLERGEH